MVTAHLLKKAFDINLHCNVLKDNIKIYNNIPSANSPVSLRGVLGYTPGCSMHIHG
jgi:hypothetical protein